MPAKKLPYIKFFTGDYVKDTRVLSLEARAVWMDMLCLMQDGDKRGYLSRGGTPMTAEQLARFSGCTVEVMERAMVEIVTSGVAAKEEGVIYSRRIVRDEKQRRLAVQSGRKGGNPALKGGLNQTDNQTLKDTENQSVGMDYGNGFDSGLGIGAAGVGGVGGGVPAFDLTPEGLGQAWAFYFRGSSAGQKNPFAVAKEFREWIDKLKVSPAAILAAIQAPERDRTEPIWALKTRLTRTAGPPSGDTFADKMARAKQQLGGKGDDGK